MDIYFTFLLHLPALPALSAESLHANSKRYRASTSSFDFGPLTDVLRTTTTTTTTTCKDLYQYVVSETPEPTRSRRRTNSAAQEVTMVSAISLDLSGLKEAIATAVKEGVEKAHRDTIEAGYVKKEQVAMMVEEAVKEVRNETQLDKNKEAEAEGAVVMRRSAMVKEILGTA